MQNNQDKTYTVLLYPPAYEYIIEANNKEDAINEAMLQHEERGKSADSISRTSVRLQTENRLY